MIEASSARRPVWFGAVVGVIVLVAGLLSITASARGAGVVPGAAKPQPVVSSTIVPTPITVRIMVGQSGRVGVGGEAEDCTSAAPAQVACMVLDSTSLVELWCLNPTPPGGVALTVTPSETAPVAPINVNCAPMPPPAIRIPGSATITLYTGTADYDTESCSTNVAGTGCSTPDSSNQVTVECGLGAPVGLWTATVVGSDPTAMNGTSMSFNFSCM